MEATYWLVLGFCIWSILLVLGIGLQRLNLVSRYHHKVNSFKASYEDGSDLVHRLGRAHSNCYENLSILLGIVLVAYVTHNIAITNHGAYLFLGLRMAQSIVHIISTKPQAVLIRFLLFASQLAIMIYWISQLLTSVFTLAT